MEKYFEKFRYPIITVFIKSEMIENEKEKILNELCKKLNLQNDRIRFYVNPKQYGKIVFQMYISNKVLENLFKIHLVDYDKVFKNFETELIAGKLDGDGNINIVRGIIEIYYVSKKSLKQLEIDYRILSNLGLNPTIRKHKHGKALVLGSKKKDFKLLINFSKKLIPYIKLHHKKELLNKLSQGNRLRKKDMSILSLISEGYDNSEKLREKLNYSQRSMRQIMQNLQESNVVTRKRISRNEFYIYQINQSYSNSTKDES